MSVTKSARRRGKQNPPKKETLEKDIKKEDITSENIQHDKQEMENGLLGDKKDVSKSNRKRSGERQERPSKRIKSEESSNTASKSRGKKNTPSVSSSSAKNSRKTRKPKEEITAKEKRSLTKENPSKDTGSDSIGDDTEDKKKPKASRRSPKKKKGQDDAVPRPLKYESLGEGPPPIPYTGKMYVGCHVSGAGGVWNAFADAQDCKADSFALFLRSQRQWAAKPLDDNTVEKWHEAMKDTQPHLILPHGSYLMNLGSPVEDTLKKSRVLLLEEIQRCERLGIPHYNFHPGSSLGKVSRENCCKTIAESINIVLGKTKGVVCVLENMSRQGFTVGGDFHELRTIIENVDDKTRVGVCLDTCHTHAAGYDLGTEDGFNSMMEDFGKIVGWQFLRALHINDSKGQSGDHLDRHETIGKGTIGLEGFRRFMNCDRFRDIPLILETPWTDNAGYAKEIKLLRSLIQK